MVLYLCVGVCGEIDMRLFFYLIGVFCFGKFFFDSFECN